MSSRWRGISSLKVPWRRDLRLDDAVARDSKWRLCFRVVREVLASPRSALPLYYLERRRERLRLPVRVKTFLSRNPTLLLLYPDRRSPTSQPIPFVKPSPRLARFLDDERRIHSLHEPLAVSKLCKLLMMSRHRAISLQKLVDVRRDFGFPDDFAASLVPKHPQRIRIVGSGSHAFLELASWDEDMAKSVIERRAEEEAELTGIRMRTNFEVQMPAGLVLRKDMREWTRDWMELPYISPYADAAGLRPGSREMEKRMVGVLHELLSLAVLRRMAVASVGKLSEEYRLSNEFGSAFARHPGIFYVSCKGGIETAVLREAYRDGELVDRDPLLEIRDKFVEMLHEGHQQWCESVEMEKQRHQVPTTTST